MPRVEGRLEVDERDVERALVDLVRRLERGHHEPVDRQQDDQRPAAQQAGRAELGERVHSSGERRRNGSRGRSPRRGLRRRDRTHATVRHASPDDAHVGGRHEGHDDEQEVGDRRRPAEVERVPVDVGLERQRLGGRARSAAEQDVGHVDDLEALDQADEDDRRDDRQDRRRRDAGGSSASGSRRRRRPPHGPPGRGSRGRPAGR